MHTAVQKNQVADIPVPQAAEKIHSVRVMSATHHGHYAEDQFIVCKSFCHAFIINSKQHVEYGFPGNSLIGLCASAADVDSATGQSWQRLYRQPPQWKE
jgi:hypothetical protein